MLFKVSKLEYRHSGQTDGYYRDTGETVEAETAAHAPSAFAVKKGFAPEAALRWTETCFDIGNDRFILSPA